MLLPMLVGYLYRKKTYNCLIYFFKHKQTNKVVDLRVIARTGP